MLQSSTGVPEKREKRKDLPQRGPRSRSQKKFRLQFTPQRQGESIPENSPALFPGKTHVAEKVKPHKDLDTL